MFVELLLVSPFFEPISPFLTCDCMSFFIHSDSLLLLLLSYCEAFQSHSLYNYQVSVLSKLEIDRHAYADFFLK